MKTLLLNHYKLIKQRGLITSETTLDDFMMKLEAGYLELLNAYADDVSANRSPSDSFMAESIELLLIITDMAQHYNIDLPEQIGKSNKRNDNLISHLNFIPL